MSKIDEALNTLAKKFAYFDDLKEMGNYYIEECKTALLKIIIGGKPKKKEHFALLKLSQGDIIPELKEARTVEDWQKYGFNQGADEYEKKIRELFKWSR